MTPRKDPASRWRTRVAAVLVVVGCLLIPLAILGSWIRITALESTAWATVSGQVLDDPTVRTRVSHELVDRVFAAVDPAEVLGAQLPPRLKFLSGPATASAQQLAYTQVNKLLASQKFRAAWREANLDAHRELIAIVEHRSKIATEANGHVELDVRPLLKMVATEIGLKGRIIDRIPDQTAMINIGLEKELETVRSTVVAIRTTSIIFIVTAAMLLIGAMWSGWDQRLRVLRWMANGVMIGGAFLLVLRSVGGEILVSRVVRDPANRAAVTDIWHIATNGVALAGWVVLVIGIALRLLVWIATAERESATGRVLGRAGELAHRFPVGRVLIWAAPLAVLLLFRPSLILEHMTLVLVIVVAVIAIIEFVKRRNTSHSGA